MKRTNLNFIIDSLAYIGFVLLVATGILIRYLLPPGSGLHSTIWGLDRHGWGDVHFWMAIGLLCTMALHVVLHWKWITNVVRGRPAKGSGVRVALGVVGFLGVIIIALAPLFSPVEVDQTLKQHKDHSRDATEVQNKGVVIGSASLREVEKATGVPTSYIIKSLGLPAEVDPDERLGRLKRDHGFHLDDVRRVVNDYDHQD